MATDHDLATFDDMMALELHGADTYVGIGPRYPWGGLYGGQIVAQCLRAAGLTVEPQFLPHSLHGYFIRRGDHSEPIRFEVDRIRNGRSFCTRRVIARQSVGAIFNLSASFHVVEDQADVQSVRMDSGSPDDFVDDGWSHVFDRRSVNESTTPGGAAGRASAWLRMREPVDDDVMLRACALAFLSDDLPTEAALADHPDRHLVTGEGDWGNTFMNASLDHSVWFHRSVDPAAWHLHELQGNGLVGGRGLAVGNVFTEGGLHAATVVQEVLVRRIRT